jgi:general stress protein CsbA
VLLVALTVVYSAIAVKRHVNTANTLEALFKGVDSEYLKEFVIVRPDC